MHNSTTGRSYFRIFALAAALVALTACTQTRFGAGPAPQTAPQQAGIDGRWQQVGSTVVTTFDRGQFQSVNSQTSDTLAAGAYRVNSADNISMEWISAFTSQKRSANCRLSAPDVMDCKPTNGTGFQIRRIA